MSAGSYIGRSPQFGFFETQTITTANGVLTSFALNFTTADSSQLLVSVGGVIQQPGTAYTVDASTPQNIVFTEAPANGIEIFIIWLGKQTTGPQFSSGMLTDKAAITSLAATDDFLVYDADASALKKVNYQYVHSGVSNMAGNTVKVRDNAAAGAPSDKEVTNTQILIGDGTGFTAAALSGDVLMTNAGAVTIQPDSVELDMIVDTTTNNRVLGAATAGTVAEVQINGPMIAMGSDARGDILFRNATTYTRLAKGTADQVLTMGANDPSWSDSVGGAAWVIKTAAYTAVAGDGVMVDTDSAAITITLPISSGPPALGDFVRIMDATGNAATNNITVARNGNNIQGAAADLTIATNRAAIGLVYVNATEGWVLIEN